VLRALTGVLASPECSQGHNAQKKDVYHSLQDEGAGGIGEFSGDAPVLQAVCAATVADAEVGDEQTVFTQVEQFPETFNELLAFLGRQFTPKNTVLQRFTGALEALVDLAEPRRFRNVVAYQIHVFHDRGIPCGLMLIND